MDNIQHLACRGGETLAYRRVEGEGPTVVWIGGFRSDMEGTKDIKQRIIRGGSFLCSEGYCTGYRTGARQLSDDITASNHTGFRCVKTP